MPHRSRLCAFVIDCKVDDIRKAAEFWSQALGRPVKPPVPGFETYAELESSPEEPMFLLQKVEHESRIHMDIESDDLEAEAKRLEALGCRRIGFVRKWWVMESPTGQRFCIVNPQKGPLTEKKNATEWP